MNKLMNECLLQVFMKLDNILYFLVIEVTFSSFIHIMFILSERKVDR